MVEFSDLLLLIAVAGLASTDVLCVSSWVTKIGSACIRFAIPGSVAVTLLGCLFVAAVLHEPVPRIHDEFSYILMADTFVHGHVANQAPPLSEFFDTFHILVRPVYASKYFPAQGAFLALGQKLVGRPAAGLWLSSALACAATIWMLQAWTSPRWALLGGSLMIIHYGIFSYWSQSYWGGMTAALGGALFFGGLRRLWDRLCWQNSFWLGFGLVILATSRPLEGAVATLPASALFFKDIWHKQRWCEHGFWLNLVVPLLVVLVLGSVGMLSYNHAITGSAFKTPYMLHEEQYQESPPLVFIPMRPSIIYSSPWVAYYYHVQENRQYAMQRIPSVFIAAIGRKLGTWWAFYCGVLLSVPLVLPGVLKRSTRYWQIGLIVVLAVLAVTATQQDIGLRLLLDVLALGQIGLLFVVFDRFWPRLATATCTLLLLQMLVVKWAFPHYFSPAASLVVFLQVEGLRRIWNWRSSGGLARSSSRNARRRMERTVSEPVVVHRWRKFVLVLPLACMISLGVRVVARRYGWTEDVHGPDRQTLLMHDWSLHRADIEHWLDEQPSQQLVFVRYSPRHKVNFEWVYNHADLIHSHVVWARDLGTDHDRLLLDYFPERTAWVIDADLKDPKLVPYAEAGTSIGYSPAAPRSMPEREHPDE